MQQLLGDHAGITDSTFLRELFLQRLPSNVRMVLEELAELADKITEVAAPTIAATTASPLSTTPCRNTATSFRGQAATELCSHPLSLVSRTLHLTKPAIQTCPTVYQ